AALDNLTTTIVMVALLRKLISDKGTRWFYASIIVIAANAGGAWSPIGDVTTIMLWIGGQVTTVAIMTRVFLPSLVSMVVPLTILSFILKGEVKRPEINSSDKEFTTSRERIFILILGIGLLINVPVFKTLTHLPPYIGMLFGLGVLWLTSEIMHRGKDDEIRRKLTIFHVVKKVDTPTIFFFLGILVAVAALQSAGQLGLLANFLDEKLGNIYLINIAIGALSAIVDNVPLVAGAMGMYPIISPESLQVAADPEYMKFFMQDGLFWEFLAYCAGTGGSMLIIGSAAGVAAMGLERIDFIWYMKKISWLAVIGYISGAAAYWLQAQIWVTH
ncbi:MAG: sodium:proton antiporter, partial [Bacteroidia bacterium]